VLLITKRLGDLRPIIFFDHLGYLHALYRAGADVLATNPYVPQVRRLRDEGQTELFVTLEAYLDAGGNGMQTKAALHIHRSTLNYRLERIREICGFDLSDPLERTNLQIALKLLRLFQAE
jgi:sugar diacid utilization regulator